MKKFISKFISAVIASSMALSSVSLVGVGPMTAVSVTAASNVQIYDCAGVQEAAYVTWAAVSGTSRYYVSYSKNGTNFTEIDDSLIRQYPDRWRADIVGLAAGNYTIKVTAKDKNGSTLAEGTKTCTVVAQDRTGFTFSPNSKAYDNGGCGAYNKDGTLKSGANVIYVTEKNFDSVTLTLKNKSNADYKATGVAEICKVMGEAAAKGNTNPPLAIRFIGTINDSHTGLASPSLLETKGAAPGTYKTNITFEGIGDDTIFYGIGLRLNGVANCEIRNISFYNWHDDAIQLQGNGNSNHWIHNNDLFYGENHGGDQKKGDGATDVKDDSMYITYSYNHYWDNGKTSLCGMKGETGDNYITYHHNWFDHSDSRHPRIRTMFVHVYNNYYDGNSKYGVGAALSSSAFVEGNYFRNCKHPMLSSKQGSDIMENAKTGAPDFSNGGTFSGEAGGVIKAYNNHVEGSDADKFNGGYEPVYYDASDTKTNGKATQFDAYLAKSRSEQVPSSVKALSGGKTFNNSNVDSYILSIPLEEPATAKDKVTKYAGRIGNHFSFTFTSADDSDSDINTALSAKLDKYVVDTSDDYKSIGGSSDGSGPVETSSTTTEATTETTSKDNTDKPTETTTSSYVDDDTDDDGYAAAGTYVMGSNASGGNFNITAKTDTQGNVRFAFRDITATGGRVRSMDGGGYVSFETEKTADITITAGSGKDITIRDLDSNEIAATYPNSKETTISLPAGRYVIESADTGSNAELSKMVISYGSTTVDPEPEQPSESTTSAPVSGKQTITSDQSLSYSNYKDNAYFDVSNMTHSSKLQLSKTSEIKFTVAAGATVKITASHASSSSTAADRTLTMAGGAAKTITYKQTEGTRTDTLGENLAAGTYTITVSDAINVTSVDVTFPNGAGEEPGPTVVKGDANGDGKVDANDVHEILQYVTGQIAKVADEIAAEVTGDNKVDEFDAYKINRFVKKLISSL